MTALGVVIIGRNEGERLPRCITSVRSLHPVVYVDSSSDDGSCEVARSLGTEVVVLDRSAPFTAARGRNAGMNRLLQIHPDLRYIQFVDGDCEIHPEWMPQAIEAMESDSSLGIVCGRLREKDRTSIYSRLCDMEWNGPIGELSACGGVMLARVSAIQQAGGFNEDVAAGEEADLCIRLRKRSFRIVRIPAEMGTHDAAMTRFSQWWRRASRAGQSYMQGSLLHGGGQDRRHSKAVRSILFWSVILPVIAVLTACVTHGFGLLLFALYPLLWAKIVRHRLACGEPANNASLFATFCVIAKFAQVVGIVRYLCKPAGARKTHGGLPLGNAIAETHPTASLNVQPSDNQLQQTANR